MSRRKGSPKPSVPSSENSLQKSPAAAPKRQDVEVRPSQSVSTTTTSYLQAEIFEGPLPHPAILAEYDQICPGAASRIIAMAEKQAEHRQSLEHMVVSSNCKSQDRGPILGFILAAGVILFGGYLILQGREVSGFVAVISALTSIVLAFVYGKREHKKELQEKKREERSDLGSHWDYSLPEEEADQPSIEDRSAAKATASPC